LAEDPDAHPPRLLFAKGDKWNTVRQEEIYIFRLVTNNIWLQEKNKNEVQVNEVHVA
jgi:hypothetical protein